VVVEALLALLAAGVTPVIPEHGSVGASGDLAQLAHLALPLLGEGEVLVDGDRVPAAEGLRRAGLAPLALSYKEGLSLVNGTEGMLALACLAVADAEELAAAADVACAMSIEGLLGTDRPFQARVHELRPHPGQQTSAANLRRLLAGSPILASHRHSDHAIQDAYSLRCAPQVHGACRDVIAFARGVVERELASVTDNPVVFADSGDVVSVGNFHGEPLAFVLDFLAIALAELGGIAERRVDRLLDPALNHGLPPFLGRDPGLNSGLMLTQYTAAALVSDCKVLAHPASVDSIPTSGNQEDHVSMGWGAGLKLRRVVANVRRTVAIEALCAAQAIDLRVEQAAGRGEELAPGPAVGAALARLRQEVAPLGPDRYLAPDLAAVEGQVASGALVDAAEQVVGPLR
jgi:histidine ammonia-lyase